MSRSTSRARSSLARLPKKCQPLTKNTALMPRASRMSSTLGVRSGAGPSSKVSRISGGAAAADGRGVSMETGPGRAGRLLRRRARALRALSDRAPPAAAAGAGPFPARPAAEERHLVGDDLGHVALLAGGLVVPRARLQAPLDVDLPPLVEVLGAVLAGLAPNDDLVPFGAFLALLVL